MLTIGQFARALSVSTKAVRVYHAKGLLPEPERDASGYRRYDAQAIIDGARVVTLAKSGVPLARIPAILESDSAEAARQIEIIDAELQKRIADLEFRRQRLHLINQPDRLCLPPVAIEYMDLVTGLGLSPAHVNAIRDGWILAFALAPAAASALIPSRTMLLSNPDYLSMLMLYDEIIDADVDDPRIDKVADVAYAMASSMTLVSDLPDFTEIPSEIIELLDTQVESPAWRRVDELVSQRLRAAM